MRTYPCSFGGKLLQLVRSLPPAVRRLKKLFPLLSMQRCIALSQFATETDHEDVRLLHDAAFGQRLGPCPVKRTENDGAAADAGEDVRAALDALLTEIDPLHLAQTIGSPIDTARAGYTLDTATVESYDEFRDITAAFHLHLLRHTGTIGTPVHPGATADDAHALLDRAFARQGGFDGALAEACDGTRGGMRLILDAMTDQYKFEQQAKHINAVMRAALDPRDWDEKVAFMKALLERLAPHLPPDVRSEPAERFARRPEIVVRAYAKSIERLTALLRAL